MLLKKTGGALGGRNRLKKDGGALRRAEKSQTRPDFGHGWRLLAEGGLELVWRRGAWKDIP